MNKKNIDWDAVQYARWLDWEHTFIFIPKRDVNGKLIFGKAWKRERYGSVLGEFDEKTNMTVVYSITDIGYAGRKEVFMRKLQDNM